jgi:hypothetical protein
MNDGKQSIATIDKTHPGGNGTTIKDRKIEIDR